MYKGPDTDVPFLDMHRMMRMNMRMMSADTSTIPIISNSQNNFHDSKTILLKRRKQNKKETSEITTKRPNEQLLSSSWAKDRKEEHLPLPFFEWVNKVIKLFKDDHFWEQNESFYEGKLYFLQGQNVNRKDNEWNKNVCSVIHINLEEKVWYSQFYFLPHSCWHQSANSVTSSVFEPPPPPP